MSNTTSNSLDPYAAAVLADITAHPNQQYFLSNNVWNSVARASPTGVPSNATFSPYDLGDSTDSRSTLCKWFGVNCTDSQNAQNNDAPKTSLSCDMFGANCVDDNNFVTNDCPSYLKFFNLCKYSGNFNQAASDAASAVSGSTSTGCAVCDSISKWFDGKVSTIAAIAIGFVLLFGAFMIWKN